MAGRRAAVALVVLATAACGGTQPQEDVGARADALWSSRAPYVGDNSRMAELVEAVGVGPVGGYGLELQKAQPPYALTVELERPDKPFADTDLSSEATLLLGLTGDLDTVTFTAGPDRYSLTADAASGDLGYDVKRLGQEEQALVAFLEEAED